MGASLLAPDLYINFHMSVFQIKLKYHCSKPINLQKFLMYSRLSLNGHLELVPAFLYSFYLTLYKTDISLRRTISAGPKGVRLGES